MRNKFSFLITFFFVTSIALQTVVSADEVTVFQDAKKTFQLQQEQKKEKEKLVTVSSSPMDYITKNFLNSETNNSLELPQNIANISELVQFDNENFDEVVDIFINNCKSATTRKMYGSLCDNALHVSDKELFIKKNFKLYKIIDEQKDEGTLTGYYEPELHGSLTKHDQYIYPIYTKPSDKSYIRVSIQNGDKNATSSDNSRAQHSNLNLPTLCYVDDKIEAFFLEIQGSGRVKLDTNETLCIGYNGTNGHKYSSIGKYLIAKGYMKENHMSLEDIKLWAKQNPDKLDEVLNHNERVVYFKKRDSQNVTGSLGVPLTPMRSVAIDSAYVPLGSMLYIDAKDYKHSIKNIVFAQDRGAAIKSPIRADLFTGYGKQALAIAGNLKAKLKMWIFLPKAQEK
jgi:membrane-bound lytic murein transglycosylase A